MAHRIRKEERFIANHGIGDLTTFALVVSGPVGQSSLNIGEFAFRPFDGRAAPVVLVEVLFLLSQHL